MRVVAIPYDSPGTVAYYIVMRTGSRDEVEAGHSGFAHFFEHMMFRGTEKYPQGRLQRRPQAAGRRLERLHHRRPDGLPHGRAGEPAAADHGHRVRPLQEPQVQPGRLSHRGAGRPRRVQQERLEPVPAAVREAPRPRLRRSTPTSTRRSASWPTSRRCPTSTTTACSSSTASTGRRTPRCWWWATCKPRERLRAGEAVLRRLEEGVQGGGHPRGAGAEGAQDGGPRLAEPDPSVRDDRPTTFRPTRRRRSTGGARPPRGAPVQRVRPALPGSGGQEPVGGLHPGGPLRQPRSRACSRSSRG